MKWLLLKCGRGSHGVERSAAKPRNEAGRAKNPSRARGIARLLRTIARRRELILSIGCLAISFFAFMALVQAEPLSFAVPASAASFIIETLLAKLVLKEQVGVRRAAGALLVLGGIVLLAR